MFSPDAAAPMLDQDARSYQSCSCVPFSNHPSVSLFDYLIHPDVSEEIDGREADPLTGNIIGAAIDVHRALGQTDAGRYLVVFYIHKLTREALILSARDMDHKERRSYGR